MPLPSRPRPLLERLLAASAWATAGVLSGLVALRVLRRDHHRYQIALEGTRDAAFTAAPVVLAVGLAGRRPLLSTVGAALTAGSVLSRGHLAHRRSTADTNSDESAETNYRIVTANLLRGNPRVAELGRQLIADAADVVVLQELSDEHVADLSDCGLLAAYPHHLLDPTDDFHGSAVLSRWPLSHQSVLDVLGFGMAAADVHAPGGVMNVVSVHVVNPANDFRITTWREQLNWLAAYSTERAGPVVLAGDFNATLDHRPLRMLLDAGLIDAHDQVGVGLGLTWPQRHWGTGRGLYFPVMRLDHVLVTAALTVRSVRTAPSAGSDHRRVIAEIGRRNVADRSGDRGSTPGLANLSL